jgi:hypothetical protein
MNKLTDVGIRAILAKPRTGRVELPDGAVPGLTHCSSPTDFVTPLSNVTKGR